MADQLQQNAIKSHFMGIVFQQSSGMPFFFRCLANLFSGHQPLKQCWGCVPAQKQVLNPIRYWLVPPTGFVPLVCLAGGSSLEIKELAVDLLGIYLSPLIECRIPSSTMMVLGQYPLEFSAFKVWCRYCLQHHGHTISLQRTASIYAGFYADPFQH